MDGLCVVSDVFVRIHKIGVVILEASKINKIEVRVLVKKDTKDFLFGHYPEFARQDALMKSFESGSGFSAGCRLVGVHYCPIGH